MKDHTEYELEVCDDCAIWVANADSTGMDEDRAAEVADAVASFVESTGAHLFVGDESWAFSHGRCELCGALPGGRHQVLGLI